jgi:tetratricopeptide (TPR) repeat protein
MTVTTKKDVKDQAVLLAKAAALANKGMFAEAARSYRFYLSKWPDPAIHFTLGFLCHQMNDWEAAILNYEKALALKPDYVDAYLNIGSIYNEKCDFDRALAFYNKAIALNGMLPQAYYNRGIILQEMQKHEDALADYDRATALKPDFYSAYLNKSVILYELKRKSEAVRNYKRILKLDPSRQDPKWNLGLIALSEGDFAAGWPLYEERLRAVAEDYNKTLRKPAWRGQEEIADKIVFIRWEQGFGDTIHFCRYAKLVKDKGATVIFSVQDALRTLLRSLDEDITIIGENDVPSHYDFHCRLMSLPCAFGTTLETIPYPTKYLAVDPGAVEAWRPRVDAYGGVKIGIVWAGGFRPADKGARRNDDNRSITFDQILPLLDITGVIFFSLQKGPPAGQLAAATAPNIQDFTTELQDFADTAALIENLDLVITVCTSVAHLAGALGKTVWILVPFVSCWRWLENRTDSPWYNSARLFRQQERRNWGPVIEAVRRELAAFAGSPRVIGHDK